MIVANSIPAACQSQKSTCSLTILLFAAWMKTTNFTGFGAGGAQPRRVM